MNVGTGSFDSGQVISDNNKVISGIKNAVLTSGLAEGDTFDGKIQDIIGNNVKINLGDGQVLSAIIEDGVDFNIGENVSFLVKGNDGGKVFLQAFSRQSGFTDTILNSLEQSGINLTDKNLNMVKEMMAYSMSIDSNSLGAMERLANQFPEVNVSDIVAMKSHNIPINSENISQFQAYQSYEYKISDAINSLSEEVLKLGENKNGTDAVVKDFINVIKEITGKMPRIYENNELSEKVQPSWLNDVEDLMTEYNIEGSTNAEEKYAAQADGTKNNRVGFTVTDSAIENSNVKEGNEQEKNVLKPENIILNDGEKTVADGQEKSPLKLDLQMPDNMVLIKENLLSQLKEAVKELRGKWLLDIGELEGKTGDQIKKIITETYESMEKGTEKLMEALKNHGMEKTEVYKPLETIKSNIQFMNDLNHMGSYIQVPFKTSKGQTDGQLYVYNRNNKKSVEDGPITAFLHLDMEHLGAADVKITMEKSKVSTKFTLEDVVSQDIVEKNLPKLKERLEKLGYNAELTAEVVYPEKKVPPFEQILEADKPKRDVKRYSFDIRL